MPGAAGVAAVGAGRCFVPGEPEGRRRFAEVAAVYFGRGAIGREGDGSVPQRAQAGDARGLRGIQGEGCGLSGDGESEEGRQKKEGGWFH